MSEQLSLSQAIRLGAMLKPQARQLKDRDGGTCAMGAAFEACGFNWNHGEMVPDAAYDMDTAWSGTMLHQCPACDAPPFVLTSQVRHLNDFHRWSREAIADWVESIEAAQPVEKREEVANGLV